MAEYRYTTLPGVMKLKQRLAWRLLTYPPPPPPQRSQVLGNKIEMEITKYVEDNPTILQMGLHFEFNDARARVSAQLQKNRDRCKLPPPQPHDPTRGDRGPRKKQPPPAGSAAAA